MCDSTTPCVVLVSGKEMTLSMQGGTKTVPPRLIDYFRYIIFRVSEKLPAFIL
jgi:hypothetical protein